MMAFMNETIRSVACTGLPVAAGRGDVSLPIDSQAVQKGCVVRHNRRDRRDSSIAKACTPSTDCATRYTCNRVSSCSPYCRSATSGHADSLQIPQSQALTLTMMTHRFTGCLPVVSTGRSVFAHNRHNRPFSPFYIPFAADLVNGFVGLVVD
jgi:hypothetical protein